jgi:hypothetical protein
VYPDDCQAGLNIKSRLETDPGIDATLVETLEGLDPVPGKDAELSHFKEKSPARIMIENGTQRFIEV